MKWVAVLAVTLAVAGSVSGCSVASTCVDWVDISTRQEAVDSSDLVIRGKIIGPAGTDSLFGVQANAYSVEVVDVVKGTPDNPLSITVVSTPQTCNGDAGPYPGGDPVDATTTVELFLVREGDVWRTLTPSFGVLVVAGG